MRISDWSSDVCSSDLSIISFTGKDLLRHGPGLQCVTFLAQLGARLLQQVGQLDGVGIGAAWNLSAANMSIGAVNDGQAQFTITVLWSPGHALKWTKGAVGNQKSRSEEHTSELQSLMRITYAVFCLKKKIKKI